MDTPSNARYLVAEEIRAHMARRRIKQAQIALVTGKSQSYVSRRLTGDVPFDLDDLENIAALMDVPITDLFPRRPRQGSNLRPSDYKSADSGAHPALVAA